MTNLAERACESFEDIPNLPFRPRILLHLSIHTTKGMLVVLDPDFELRRVLGVVKSGLTLTTSEGGCTLIHLQTRSKLCKSMKLTMPNIISRIPGGIFAIRTTSGASIVTRTSVADVTLATRNLVVVFAIFGKHLHLINRSGLNLFDLTANFFL